MSTEYFINTQSFETRLTNTDGGTAIISGFLTELYKTWTIPFAAGSAGFELDEFEGTEQAGLNYQQALGIARSQRTGVKINPFILTVEVIEGKEQLVIYTLRLKVPPKSITGFEINSKIFSNGDNKLVKAVGGEIDTLQGGISWSVTNEDGKVETRVETEEETTTIEIKSTVIFTSTESASEEKKSPIPFILFNRNDIS